MVSDNKKKQKKTIFPLFKELDTNQDHPIMRENWTEEPESTIPNKFIEEPKEMNTSIWPVDSNIVIENVLYENNTLLITVLNLAVDNIKITSAGVKYTNSIVENINFQSYDFILQSGKNTLRIPCPNGKPYKFVFRTANRTGAGSSIDNLSW